MSATGAPISAHLSELLAAHRESTRPKAKRRQTDVGLSRTTRERPYDNDDLFFAEATTPESRKASLTLQTDDADSIRTFDMQSGFGLRETNLRLEQVTKENFDLKIEVSRRRDKEAKLTEKLESMSKELTTLHNSNLELKTAHDDNLVLHNSNVKLQAAHDTLERDMNTVLAVSEKNERGLKDALSYIIELQEQMETLKARLEEVESDSPTLLPTSTTAPEASVTRSCKPQVSFAEPTAGDATRPRHATKTVVHHLRNVLLETEHELRPVKSYRSMLSKHEDQDTATARKSGISRGSATDEFRPAFSRNADDESHPRQDSIKRVSEWMSDSEHQGNSSPTPTDPEGRRNIDRIMSTTPGERTDTVLSHITGGTDRSELRQRSVQGTRRSPIDHDQATVTAHVPSGMDTPRARHLAPPRDSPAIQHIRNNARSALHPASDGYEIETYQPSRSREPSPHTAKLNQSQGPARQPVQVEETQLSSPDSLRQSQHTLTHKRRGLFSKRRMSDYAVESPGSGRSSFLSEAASSVRNRPSTPNTSLSSRATTSSQEAIRSDQQSELKGSSSSLSRSDVDQTYTKRSSDTYTAIPIDDTLTSVKSHRRRSAILFSSSSRHASPDKFSLQSSSTMKDLSRDGARAAWAPAAGTPTLNRHTGSKGGFMRALVGERRMSKA